MISRRGVIATLASTVLAACSGTLPEPGHPSPRPAELASSVASEAIASPPLTGDALIDATNDAIRKAKKLCRRIKDDAPVQVESVTKGAYFKKQAGLLVTTIVGAGGSVATAVLATTQKDSAGNSDAVPATAVGSITAGATAIAGVVALFVVGPPPEERIKRMNALPENVTAEVSKFDKDCPSVTAQNATSCRSQANQLEDACESLGRTLPYKTN